jgi:hypothetical protein
MSKVSASDPDKVLVKAALASVVCVMVDNGVWPIRIVLSVLPNMVLVKAD